MKNFLPAILLMTVPLLMGASSNGSSSSSDSSTPRYEKYFNKGVEAQANGDYEKAVSWYEKALEKKPDHADSWNNLGFTLRMIAKQYLTEAGDAYEKALQADPNHDEALEYQGELFLWWGKLIEANRNLERLKSMNSPEAKELGEKLEQVLDQAKTLI